MATNGNESSNAGKANRASTLRKFLRRSAGTRAAPGAGIDEALFEIVAHLNLGRAEISGANERLELARLDL